MEIFRNEPDPRACTFVIYHGASYGLPLETLIARLKVDDDPARIRGLLFAIGQHGRSMRRPPSLASSCADPGAVSRP